MVIIEKALSYLVKENSSSSSSLSIFHLCAVGALRLITMWALAGWLPSYVFLFFFVDVMLWCAGDCTMFYFSVRTSGKRTYKIHKTFNISRFEPDALSIFKICVMCIFISKYFLFLLLHPTNESSFSRKLSSLALPWRIYVIIIRV